MKYSIAQIIAVGVIYSLRIKKSQCFAKARVKTPHKVAYDILC